MKRIEDKKLRRSRRRKRVRKRLSGTSARPRMTVYKSNRHLYVQVIDDDAGTTIASATTQSKENAGKVARSLEKASALGEKIGKKLQEQEIKTVVFDRNGYKYHGLVKAIADGARKAGVQF